MPCRIPLTLLPKTLQKSLAVTPHQVNKDKEYIETKKEDKQKETELERAIRKEKERKKKGSFKHETEEERAIRKKKEKIERDNRHKLSRKEKEEKQAIHKEKEQKVKEREGKLSKKAEEVRSNKRPSKISENKKDSDLGLNYEYTDQLICASDENCVKPNDYIVDWLDCSSCKQWFHNKCVSVDPEMAKNKKFQFYCKSCEIKRSNISKKHKEYKKPRRSRDAKDEANSKINECFKNTERSESPEKYVITKALKISDKISNGPVTKSDKNSKDKPVEVVSPIKKHKTNRRSETSNRAATEPKTVGTHSSINQLLQSLDDSSKPQAEASRNQEINTSIETTSNQSNDLTIEPTTLEIARDLELESENETSTEQSLSEEIIDVEATFIDTVKCIEIMSESSVNSPKELPMAMPTKQSTDLTEEDKMESANETSIERSLSEEIIDVEATFIDTIKYTEIPSESSANSPKELPMAMPTKQSTDLTEEHKLECTTVTEISTNPTIEISTMPKSVPTSEPQTESEFVMESLSESLIESVIETSGTSFDSTEDFQALLLSSNSPDIDKIFSEMLIPPPILPILDKDDDTYHLLDQMDGFQTSKELNSDDFIKDSDDTDYDSLTELATQVSTMPTSEPKTKLIRRFDIQSLTNSIGESLKASISECLKNSLTESIIESVIESLTDTGTEASIEPATESQNDKISKHATELVTKLIDESSIEHKPTTQTAMEHTFDKELMVKNKSSDKKFIKPIESQFLIKKVVKNEPSRYAPCLESLVYEPVSSLKTLDQRRIRKEKEEEINKTKEVGKNLSDSPFVAGPKWEFLDTDFNLKSLPSELIRKNLSICEYLKRKKEKNISDKPLTIGPEWGHEDEELSLAETFDKIKELKWGPKMESKAYEALRLGHADQTNQMEMIPASSLKTLEQRGIEKVKERQARAIEEAKEIETKRIETEEIRKNLRIPLRSGQAKQSSFVNAVQKRLRNSKNAEESECVQERPPKRRKIGDNKVENFKPHELLLSLV